MLKLTVNDFRRIERGSIETNSPVNFLVGLNQQGKSSLLGAAAMALTGTHPEWLSTRDEKVANLIRQGAKKATVELWMDGKDGAEVCIERTIAARGQTLQVQRTSVSSDGTANYPVKLEGNTTEQQGALLQEWGLTKAQLECLLHGGEYLGMTPKEQTEFLASISGAELSAEELLAMVANDGRSLPWNLPTDRTGAALLDYVLDLSETGRKLAKQKVVQAEALLRAAQDETPPRPEGEPPEDVEATINELDRRHEASIRLDGQIAAADKAIADATEVLTAKASMLEAAQAGAEKAPRAELAQATEAADAAQVRALEADQDRKEAQEALGKLGDRKLAAESTLEDLRALAGEPTCPTCQQPIFPDILATLTDAASGAVARLAQEVEEKKTGLAGLNSAWESLSQDHLSARTTEQALKRQVDSLDAALNSAQGEHERAEGTLRQAEEARAALGEPEPLEAIAAEIGTLQVWVDWQEATKAASERQAEAEAARNEVEPWEWRCVKFGSGPDSYRRNLTEGKLEALEAAVNRALEPLLHEQIVFPTGDAGTLVRGMGYSYPVTAQNLSGSERMRIQFAIQYGLCRTLNFPLLLLDCEAALDPASQASIRTLLRDMAREWPEMVALVAMAPTTPDWRDRVTNNPQAYEGWGRVWEVKAGRVESLLDPADPFLNPKAQPDADGQVPMIVA